MMMPARSVPAGVLLLWCLLFFTPCCRWRVGIRCLRVVWTYYYAAGRLYLQMQLP